MNIFLIRHGEETYETNDVNLSLTGYCRAQAYSVWYNQPKDLGGDSVVINAIYAAANNSISQRPYETVEPLAKSLKLTVNQDYSEKNTQALVDHIHTLSVGTNLLICWRHHDLLHLAELLGAPAADLPSTYPAEVYGWQMTFELEKDYTLERFNLSNLELMYGDCGQDPSKYIVAQKKQSSSS